MMSRRDVCLSYFNAVSFVCVAVIRAADDEKMGPVFIQEPANRIDFSNTTGATVECGAMGSPTPEIIWIFPNGTPVSEVPGLRQVRANQIYP